MGTEHALVHTLDYYLHTCLPLLVLEPYVCYIVTSVCVRHDLAKLASKLAIGPQDVSMRPVTLHSNCMSD